MSTDSTPETPTCRVQIFGQTLAIQGDADAAYIQRLSGFVSAHMERLSQEAPLTPLAQTAMLAAVNIAHELFSLRAQIEARESDLDTRTREMLARIDAEFHAESDPADHP